MARRRKQQKRKTAPTPTPPPPPHHHRKQQPQLVKAPPPPPTSTSNSRLLILTLASSLIRLHDESINIWSHALPAAFFGCKIAALLPLLLAAVGGGQQHQLQLQTTTTAMGTAMENTTAMTAVMNATTTMATAMTAAMKNTTTMNTTTFMTGAQAVAGQQVVVGAVCYPPSTDVLVALVYLVGTVACLSFSTLFHGLSSHSETVYRRFLVLDYLGIVVYVSGANIATIHLCFYANPGVRRLWIAGSLVCSVVTISVLMLPRLSGPKAAVWRVLAVLSLMSSSIVPVLYLTALNDDPAWLATFPFRHVFGKAVLLGLSALFYVTRFPEAFWPSRFDIFGASHQIFHIFVALSQACFYAGLEGFLRTRCQ